MPDDFSLLHSSPPTESIDDLPGPRKSLARQEPLAFERRYRTDAELARGGMGRVMTAHDLLLDREVAIKELLRKDSAGAVHRFEREAMLTARLQHPGIVSVYELARRDSGEPVLVMRRVKGRALDEAIVAAGTLDRRLQLLAPFIAACDAVAYAHQQGVIHRDLKPANVLLGDFGDTVVIDWGLAKQVGAIEPPPGADEPLAAGDEPSLTMKGALVGTPHYMSPEQARGEAAGARSDVWALGVMLYQLLSGELPFPGNSRREVLERVKLARRPPLAEKVPGLPRDLITVVERAMAPVDADRFAQAGELAAELKRFQTGSLLVSHDYSRPELFKRWLRRNAPIVIATAVFAVVLAISGAAAVHRVLAERDRANELRLVAERETKKAQAVSDFLQTTLASPSPISGTRDTKVLDVLDGAADRVGKSFANEPEVEASLRHSLGVTFRDLTQLDKAEAQLDQARALRVKLLGPEHPDTLSTRSELMLLHLFQARWELAAKEGKELWEARRRVLGPDAPETLSTLADYASSLAETGRREEAVELFKQLIAARTRVFGADDKRTLLAVAIMGTNYRSMHRYAESERATRQAFEGELRVLGPDAFDTLYTESDLADILVDEGKYPEAEEIYRRVLAAQQRVGGATQYNTLYTNYQLSQFLCAHGKAAEGQKMIDALDPLVQQALTESHSLTKLSHKLRGSCGGPPAANDSPK